MSEVEILSSFACDLCSTAEHFVYTSESSIQRSEQSVFIVPLTLPSSTIRNPLTTDSPNPTSPAPSGPKFNGNVFTAAPASKFIFTHSNRFGLVVAPRSKPPSENELAEVSYVYSLPSCHPTGLQLSFHPSKLQPSFHSSHSNHRSMKCQWNMSVQIPEFPSLSLISSFQDLRDQISMFYPCASLWHLWFLWIFLWIIP